jgi:hypothetical protein
MTRKEPASGCRQHSTAIKVLDLVNPTVSKSLREITPHAASIIADFERPTGADNHSIASRLNDREPECDQRYDSEQQSQSRAPVE